MKGAVLLARQSPCNYLWCCGYLGKTCVSISVDNRARGGSHLEFDEVGQLGFAEDIGQLEAVIERGVRPFEQNVFKHGRRVADDDRVALERVLGEFV